MVSGGFHTLKMKKPPEQGVCNFKQAKSDTEE